MSRKRIGVFIGGITQNFSSRVCRIISKKADEYGFDVFYFSTFNSYDDNLLYLEGEQKVFTLPNYEQLDGIIVAPDTLYLHGSEQFLRERFEACKKPVISLRSRMEGFYNVLVDETRSMERLISHFIEEHHFTDICFMTGRMEMEDAQKRLQGFQSVMSKHNLPVTENMIYYGDYWKTKSGDAVDFFLKVRGGKYPQAIVCSNDYMAVGVCGELEKRGIRVPQDICVSGYDDVPEAKQCIPALSTISVPFEKMAERAVDLLQEIFEGKTPDLIQYIDVEEKLRGSCGCNRDRFQSGWYEMAKEIEEKRTTIYNTIFMNADLEGVTNEETLIETVSKYDCGENATKTWFCLCDETEELSEEDRNVGGLRREYTHRMLLRAVKERGKSPCFMRKFFDRADIIPEEERKELKNGNFYVVGLHYKNHVLGYAVTHYANYDHYNDMMQPWTNVFSVAVEHYRLYQHLNAMADIERLYKEDTLTGIFNRRGFEEHARKLYADCVANKRGIAVISVDMDYLKKINDTYGHPCGDDALCRVANAMKTVSPEGCVYARTGGDEFNVAFAATDISEADAYVKSLRQELVRLNKECNSEFTSNVSCGICFLPNPAASTLLKALKLSDEVMYLDKKKRKALRQD